MNFNSNPEKARLEEDRTKRKNWRKWGPYLSERQWGTVREDYSHDSEAWYSFPFEHSVSRAYRWGEDGIAGISDKNQFLCFSVALWNGKDPIIKERLFGLTGPQGNHGEDVKEYYFYLDNTPTHSYMKYLYKYPQQEFPYEWLRSENQKRDRFDKEFELVDTGIFNENKYFDVFVEYAKADTEDILVKINVINRADEPANVSLLPTLFFRNKWSWSESSSRPKLEFQDNKIHSFHPKSGEMFLYFETPQECLFTENETNFKKLYEVENKSKYTKDGINDYVVNDKKDAVNPENKGTKTSLHYVLNLKPQEEKVIKLRLSRNSNEKDALNKNFDKIFEQRKKEADEFYNKLTPFPISDEMHNVQRQAFAGLLWSKQFYHYDVEKWLNGDETQPHPPEQRKWGRNSKWKHLNADDILSMPDKWEYPWFASWDTAFHTIPISLIDPEFAKEQLILFCREWYMHPNGQIPAYEWNFSDVNPPVLAWAALRIFRIEKKMFGREDRQFLEKIFQKLLLNFTWWVNRKDPEDRNVFEGGFLGLDNIGVFNRSEELPNGSKLSQADGTSWMAMYSLNMLAIAIELASENNVYEDIATKFFEHFMYIVDSMNNIGGTGFSLWDEEDKFYYDVLHLNHNHNDSMYLKVRSMVGLIPLFAVETIDKNVLDKLPDFKKRFEWFMKYHPDIAGQIACMESEGIGERRLLSLVDREKLEQILATVLNENEFLSDYGIRSLSKFHDKNPYNLYLNGNRHCISYEPAESESPLFGGNSNWRGPIWFPVNYLLIEAIQKFHYYYGDDFKVECPKGSGQFMNLWEVATELSHRLIKIFLEDESGYRASNESLKALKNNPDWKNNFIFSEYFHGCNGEGLGASHQTGWTGLIAKLIQQCGEYCLQNKPPAL